MRRGKSRVALVVMFISLKRYILQKTFKGGGQKQVPLGTEVRAAITAGHRFMRTTETDSFEKARAELRVEKALEKGDDPAIDQIEDLCRRLIEASLIVP